MKLSETTQSNVTDGGDSREQEAHVRDNRESGGRYLPLFPSPSPPHSPSNASLSPPRSSGLHSRGCETREIAQFKTLLGKYDNHISCLAFAVSSAGAERPAADTDAVIFRDDSKYSEVKTSHCSFFVCLNGFMETIEVTSLKHLGRPRSRTRSRWPPTRHHCISFSNYVRSDP